jgi:hypothetical protein
MWKNIQLKRSLLHVLNPIIDILILKIAILERSSAGKYAVLCHNLRDFSEIYVKPLIRLENKIFCGRLETIEY